MASSGRLAASSSSASSRSTLAVPTSRSDAAPIRRHSLFGTEDRVVLDIGSRWSKVGFSGEAQPRRIFKTVEAARRPGIDFAPDCYPQGSTLTGDEVDDAATADAALQRQDLLWDLDISRGTSTSSVQSRRLLLKARLTVLLRKVYSEYLLTDPAARKVILVENPHMPTLIRETIYEVLFLNLRVQMVAPMSTALLSVFATGCLTGLVVDVGALETRIVPVCHGRPLLTHFASTTRGGRGLERRLRALLLRYGRHVLPVSSDGSETSIASRTRKIRPALLTQEMLQEILVKCCFVGEPLSYIAIADRSVDTSPTRTRNRQQPQEGRLPDWQLPHTGDYDTISQSTSALREYDEANDAKTLKRLRTTYIRQTSAGHMLVPLKPPKQAWGILPTRAVTVLGATSSSPANASEDATWPREARGDLIIPGWLREHLLDFFWEQSSEKGGSDEEDESIASLLLHTIVGLPIDLRREMIGSILVSGGYASFPGFPHRVRLELESLLDAIDIPGLGGQHEEQPTTPGVKISTSLSITRTATRQPHSSTSRCTLPWRDQVTFSTLKPLRGHIAVLNDHLPSGSIATPRTATGSAHPTSPSGPSAGSGTGTGTRGGTAPLLPPLIYPWFGASLAGSLKLASVEAVTREEWETEQRRKRRREAKGERERDRAKGPRSSQEGKGKIPIPVPVSVVEPAVAAAGSTLAPPSRPGFGATGGVSSSSSSSSSSIGEGAGAGAAGASSKSRGRGSFMGVVSGLETGAYGGLSTVSRHLNVVGGPGGLRSPPLAGGGGSASGSASGRDSPVG
ncbi:actin-like ATPase domain-containing protein [Microstroma glucosiphilum]|uniref:Actin-like ATPase domain-containing protein n=1 Tax=Pseudomicrostroma glucosiphilum TaxID=1684307 RepID=A0A316U9W4_9BASI|nr:actin-like ATPase domain-containing protein [Pseudomicrostroma glucosiphilum]PWN21271.1 actin-like ATPase domain-containing protein [Pseudomicrostroma glucosiphilum]